VEGIIFVAGHQPAPAAHSLIESRVFWLGVLLAVVAALLFRWAAFILLLLALIATGLVRSFAEALHRHSSGAIYLVIAGIGLLVGLWIGGRRGLRLLGDSEFAVRVRNIHERVTRLF